VRVTSPDTDTHRQSSSEFIVYVARAVGNAITVSDIAMAFGDADVAINASGGNPGVSFKYQALNPDIATVVDGKVHAVKPGSAQVRVTSPATDMHLEVSKEITITVEKAAGNAITVSDIAMTFGDVDVAINASGGNPGVSFEYQALNPDIATVVDGKVHAVKPGTAQVRVTSPATDMHLEVSKEITVTVEKAAGNTITVSDIAMTFGDADVAINASGGNPGASFEYQSLNTDVVTVINGKVHAVKSGSARVRVISPATDTHKKVVTKFSVNVASVASAASSVEVVRQDLKSADYVVGKVFEITFPRDIDQDSVSMSNYNATILRVSGRVVRFKLLKAGTVVLYASSNSVYFYLTIYIN
ncbi:hypothetical protein, partial [Vibrio harveyi]